MPGRLVPRTWQHDPALYAPPRYRRACRYEAFVPDELADLEFNVLGSVGGLISEAEQAISELNHSSATHLAPLARLLLRTESIASSRVEGMRADARSLARAEATLDAGGKVGPETLDILANIDAMELAIEQAAESDAITVAEIEAIHAALLARDAYVRMAGNVRTVQNWIGGNDYNPCGADFIPPPPEEVARLLDDLCVFCNNDALAPLAQAAIAHAQFETIHPFEDGNGRTGRALVQVLLRRRGLAPAYVPPISVMLARNRDRYIAGLGAFRSDRVDQWIAVFAASATAASQLAARYARQVTDMQQSWRERLTAVHPRSDAAVWPLIDVLPAHPIVTTNVARAATGRTRPAVAHAIGQLEACGVLIPIGSARRNRAWEVDRLLDLITRLEAGE